MQDLLRSFDQSRSRDPQWWTRFIVTVVTGGAAFILAHLLLKEQLVGLPLMMTAYAVAMFIMHGLIAFVFFAQARDGTQVGYLVLGVTFGYSSGLWGMYPYFFPNGLTYSLPPAPVLGSQNTAAAVYVVIHAVLVVGMSTGALLLQHPRALQGSALVRRPIAVGGVVIAFALTCVWAALGSPGFPQLVTESGRWAPAMPFATFLGGLFGVACIAVLLVVARRTGSVVSRWLLAMSVVVAVTGTQAGTTERFTADWLLGRATSLILTGILGLVLLWQLDRLVRASQAAVDFDALTGADSRSAFVRILEQRLSRHIVGGSDGLLWVDLDQFRIVNEAAGQQVGNAFLMECARRLETTPALVGRVARAGGDEFALLVRADAEDALLRVARSVADHIGLPFESNETRVQVTASVGAVMLDPSIENAEDALRRAMAGTQRAKAAGGGTAAVHSPAFEARHAEDQEWRHRLAVAIREERFDNDYQPQFDTRTGQVIGVEALVRLIEGDERLSATTFVKHAEASGQIVDIGRIALMRMAKDVPPLMAASGVRPIRISFNLSVPQLADAGVAAMLLAEPFRSLRRHLVVEVTESFELTGSGAARDHLLALVHSGFGVAIDDFGAGFSNFSQLEEIGRDLIKIDRDLIVRAGRREPASLTVLTAALAVARSIASQVLAEGVETDDEAAVVEGLGIHLVQGFRYAQPMPIDVVRPFIARANSSVPA